VNHIISKIASYVAATADDNARAQKYDQMQKTDGWKIHAEYLMYIRGLMAEDLLSERFTALKPIEKDVSQRAYALVDQMVLFLIDPMAKARKLNVIAKHNLKQEATITGATNRKGMN
jgi:hypothetical protein